MDSDVGADRLQSLPFGRKDPLSPRCQSYLFDEDMLAVVLQHVRLPPIIQPLHAVIIAHVAETQISIPLELDGCVANEGEIMLLYVA